MNMDINQKMHVRWNNLLSSEYNISNGVNYLIIKLRDNNLGCR